MLLLLDLSSVQPYLKLTFTQGKDFIHGQELDVFVLVDYPLLFLHLERPSQLPIDLKLSQSGLSLRLEVLEG